MFSPCMEVAVKKASTNQCAGRMPTWENGMATMMTKVVFMLWNHPTTRMKINTKRYEIAFPSYELHLVEAVQVRTFRAGEPEHELWGDAA